MRSPLSPKSRGRRLRPPLHLLILAPLLTFLLGTLPAIGARAAPAVTGGTTAQRSRVAAVFAAMPPCCRATCPSCVCLLGDSAMDACLRACAAAHSERLINAGAVSGFFSDSSGTITLRADPGADISAAFAHEYGHYVWFHVLSPAQRDQYGHIYDAQRAAHHLVSPYAAVSVQEGFAEAFSFYVCDRPTLMSRDALSEQFLSGTLTGP